MSAADVQVPSAVAPMMVQGQPQFAGMMNMPAASAAKPAPVSLWVGDLAPQLDEAELTNVFSAFGTIVSVRLARDRTTKQSLGHAYVNFMTNADAAKAKEELNYTKIHDKVCRIMWSQRDPAARKNNVGNIFIKNLPQDMTARDLYEAYKDFGEILSVKLAVDENGTSKRYGYVHFDQAQCAENAIKSTNNLEVDGSVASVELYIPRTQRDVKDSWTNVYVKNIPKSYDMAQLNALFGTFGEITSSIIVRNEAGSRGFGFVCYKEHQAAVDACQALSGTVAEGMEPVIVPGKNAETGEPLTRIPKLYVGRAQKKSERVRAMKEKEAAGKRDFHTRFAGCNLYVKNLADSIDEERLRAEFAKFGELHSVNVSRNETGASRGYGFVCFAKPEDANAAREKMSRFMLEEKPLYVSFWEAKDARQRRLADDIARRTNKGAVNGMAPNAAMLQGMNMQGVNPMMMIFAQMMNNNPMMQQFFNLMRSNMMNNNPMMNQRGRNMPGFPMMPMNLPAGANAAAAASQRPARGNVRQGQFPARQGARMPQQQVPAQQARMPNGRPMGPNMFLGGQMAAFMDPAVLAAAGPMATVPQQANLHSQLVHLAPEDQKNLAGEGLYKKISEARPELAGKITGMLLDSLDVSEILLLLDTPSELQARIDEAIQVLEASKAPASN